MLPDVDVAVALTISPYYLLLGVWCIVYGVLCMACVGCMDPVCGRFNHHNSESSTCTYQLKEGSSHLVSGPYYVEPSKFEPRTGSQ